MKPGDFFWFDVMTTDMEAAKAFYASVTGWTVQDVSTPGMTYNSFNLGDRGVAGLMPMPDGAPAGMRPAWLGYILVDDVDAMARKIAAEGGKLMRGPIDVPGIIRFAVVADPQGAGFLIARPHMPETFMPPPELASSTPGTFGWRELMAADGATAFPFYEKLFGWKKGDAVDMGPMGIYQLFNNGSENMGGMMTKPPQSPAPPHWGYYINVPAIDAAAAKVTAAGGTILNGPIEVPGGQWVVQCFDPLGAQISFVAPKR